MKKFNEWRDEATKDQNPEVLIDTLEDSVSVIETQLKTFQGERFEGLLEIMGTLKELQRAIANVRHGIVGAK